MPVRWPGARPTRFDPKQPGSRLLPSKSGGLGKMAGLVTPERNQHVCGPQHVQGHVHVPSLVRLPQSPRPLESEGHQTQDNHKIRSNHEGKRLLRHKVHPVQRGLPPVLSRLDLSALTGRSATAGGGKEGYPTHSQRARLSCYRSELRRQREWQSWGTRSSYGSGVPGPRATHVPAPAHCRRFLLQRASVVNGLVSPTGVYLIGRHAAKRFRNGSKGHNTHCSVEQALCPQNRYVQASFGMVPRTNSRYMSA